MTFNTGDWSFGTAQDIIKVKFKDLYYRDIYWGFLHLLGMQSAGSEHVLLNHTVHAYRQNSHWARYIMKEV